MARNRNQTTAVVIAAKLRASEALKLRIAGETFDSIAKQLGFSSRQGAFESVKSALRDTLREPADELRSVDSERLDALWRKTYARAIDGDLAAIQGCLKILDRRARLLGLDAPTKSTYTDADGKGPLEVVVRLENVAGSKPNN